MEDNEHIRQLLHQKEQLPVAQKEALRKQLIEYINHLLVRDFNKVVQILYMVDVNEAKLKLVIEQNPTTETAVIIVDLLIERQDQKIEMKKSFRSNENIPDDEKW